MSKLFRLSGATRFDVGVEEWLSSEPHELYSISRKYFAQMRNCGDDVLELMHDGCPVACIGDAAFAYVNVFTSHVNVGFYTGAMLNDPERLLEGTGKRMRHIKVKPGQELNVEALGNLIVDAYSNVRMLLKSERSI